jgi:hypothetical protein
MTAHALGLNGHARERALRARARPAGPVRAFWRRLATETWMIACVGGCERALSNVDQPSD